MNGIGYKIKKTVLYILLILLSVVCMFPFLLMIVNATRSGSEIMKSFTLIPSVYLKENWATVFKYFNLAFRYVEQFESSSSIYITLCILFRYDSLCTGNV